MPGYGTGTQPPPALAAAIDQASAATGVPSDVLAGVWREESGSTFPNPYVNSYGYGGLFGTANDPSKGAPFSNFDLVASPAQQALVSAQVLLNQLRSHSGNLAEALYSYSGKSYTSVPGETTFGTVTGAISPGAAAGLSTTGTQQSPGLPLQGGASASQVPAGWPKAGTAASDWTASQAKAIATALLNGTVTGAQVDSWYPGANVHGDNPLSGIAGWVEPLVLRSLEVLAGVLLIGLGVAGIYKALSETRAVTNVTAVVDPLVGGPERRAAREGEQQARTANARKAGRLGVNPAPVSPAQESSNRAADRRRRIRSEADRAGGDIPF